MRVLAASLLATSILALGACTTEDQETASASSSVADASPYSVNAEAFLPAISEPGRDADDVKLDESRKPAEILSFFGLNKGDAVLDLLAGGGYYSEIMARAVGPAGSVSAQNASFFTSSEKGKAKWEALQARNSNVTLDLTPYHQYTAAADSFDFAMLHMIYHDAYWESEQFKFPRMEPANLLTSLYAAMKPGGIVGVVDHVGNPGDTRTTVAKLHRIDPAVVKADFANAGFVLEAESDLLANPNDDHETLVFDPSIRGMSDRFVMKFRKPG